MLLGLVVGLYDGNVDGRSLGCIEGNLLGRTDGLGAIALGACVGSTLNPGCAIKT